MKKWVELVTALREAAEDGKEVEVSRVPRPLRVFPALSIDLKFGGETDAATAAKAELLRFWISQLPVDQCGMLDDEFKGRLHSARVRHPVLSERIAKLRDRDEWTGADLLDEVIAYCDELLEKLGDRS